MKAKIISIVLSLLFISFYSTGQPTDKGNIKIYIEGSSNGVIDKSVVTEIDFHYWVNGQMEYNKGLSYSTRFKYKIKWLTVSYKFKKTVRVKEPREECPHDKAAEFDVRGSVNLTSKTDAYFVIDYGAGVQAKALDETRQHLPPGVNIPQLDVPKGFYELELVSVLKEIEGKCWSSDCDESVCTEELSLGDIMIGCKINEDGTLMGEKEWVSRYTGHVSKFSVEGCEEEENEEPEVEDPINYKIRWSFVHANDCKYKVMKALANAKDSFEEGVYARMFCFVERMLEDNESAFQISPYIFSTITTRTQGEEYIEILKRENKNELRDYLKKYCAKYDGDELVQTIATLDESMHKFFKRLEYDEDNYRLTKGQIYVKEQLVKLAGNEKHYLNCYIEKRIF